MLGFLIFSHKTDHMAQLSIVRNRMFCVSEVQDLKVILDAELFFKPHISYIANKTSINQDTKIQIQPEASAY